MDSGLADHASQICWSEFLDLVSDYVDEGIHVDAV